MPAVNIPGIGRVNFPDSMSRAAIQREAQRLASGVGRDPNTGQVDPDLAALDRLATARNLPTSLPDRGRLGNLARALRNIPQEQSLPLVGATIGSVAFPPLGAGVASSRLPMIANLLSRGAQRFGPPILAAGAGGAAGGAAAESDNPEATPGSVGRAALRSGAEMAGAEAAGLGITSAAARIAAPNLRFLDPLKGVRRQIRQLVRRVPAQSRAAARRIEEALPDRAAASARTAGESLRGTAEQLNATFRRLRQVDTADVPLPKARETAERVARAIGSERAKRFGFETAGSREFIFGVLRSGDRGAIKALEGRLGKRRLNDALALNLETLMRRATRNQGGQHVLDGAALRQAWRELPEATRRLYPKATRQAVEGLATFGDTLGRVGRFAATPVGGEVVEAMAVPAATAVFGLGVGVPLLVAKSLMNPGLLVRYLTREKLPNEVIQAIGGQIVKTQARRQAQDIGEATE